MVGPSAWRVSPVKARLSGSICRGKSLDWRNSGRQHRVGPVSRDPRAIAKQRLADEVGTIVRDAPERVALLYPSPYAVGMSSLGFQTIYREINGVPGRAAERAFLPDDVGAQRSSHAPLCTYES